uniref:Uncharacterized protein n=1 Tax=Tetradesmus obliquus TaxID=3088 RepID=A0A383VVV7_TETOB|eukprot:jgi/Sobl393_1/6021/SZX69615.1
MFAQQLLLKALQPEVMPAAAAAAGSPAGNPEQAAPQQQQQQQLRLASFSSNYAGIPVLQALPAHSLTRLQLDVEAFLETERPEVPQLLAGLSNLQELQVDSTGIGELPGSCFAAIAQLSKLTQLQLDAFSWGRMREPLQQLLAQPPPLRVLHWHVDYDWPPLNMSALTQLEDFKTYQPHPEAVLPSQLRSLQLTGIHLQDGLKPLTALQQLQRLSVEISSDIDATEAVLRLAKRLPSLQHVALAYEEANDAAVAAPSWKQLPQLQELRYAQGDCGSYRVHRCQMDDILAGVAAATSLTKLELEAVCIAECHEDESDDEAPCEWAAVAACQQLTGSTGLQDLCITACSILPTGDARALTALTNLTRLVLSNMREGVGDLAGALIAQKLTQLRHLDIRSCDLGNAG